MVIMVMTGIVSIPMNPDNGKYHTGGKKNTIPLLMPVGTEKVISEANSVIGTHTQRVRHQQ